MTDAQRIKALESELTEAYRDCDRMKLRYEAVVKELEVAQGEINELKALLKLSIDMTNFSVAQTDLIGQHGSAWKNKAIQPICLWGFLVPALSALQLAK